MSALLATLEKARRAPAAKVLSVLLDAWRLAPVAEVADAVFAADPGGAAFDGDTAAWIKAGKDPERRSALLAAWRPAKLGDCQRRLEAAAAWGPDPRTSKALEELIADVPWTSNSSRKAWTAAFALMGKLKDPRFAALKPTWNVRADQRAWLERAFAKAQKGVPASVPALTAAEAKALAALKTSAPSPKKATPSFADVYRNPTDDAPRLVLADYLQEQGDPRGQFIALQCADEVDRKTEKALLKKHEKAWLGPIAPVLGAERMFRRGFVTDATVKFRHEADAKKYGALPEWATVEVLTWSHPNPIPHGQAPWCRFIGPAFRHLRFATGPYVPHLIAAKEPWALERLEAEFEDASNLHALLASKLFPKLDVVEVTNSRVNALWISGATAFGAVTKLGFRNPVSELVDAANRTPLVELRLGGAVLTRGADGFFSKIIIPKGSRIRNTDEFPGKLPAGAFEQVVCADDRLAPAFQAKVRKAGTATPWSRAAKGPAEFPPLGLVKEVGFAANGDWVVVERQLARVIDPKTKLVRREIPVGDVTGARVTPDGETLVVTGWRSLTLYSVATGQQVASLASDTEGGPITLSPDGALLQLRYRGTVELWDLAKRRKLRPGKKGENVVAVSWDGKQVLKWKAPPAPFEVVPPGGRKPLFVLDQSGVRELQVVGLPEGRFFGLSVPDERMFVWDAKGALSMDAKLPGRPNDWGTLSADSTRIAVSVKDTAHVFEVATLSPLGTVRADKWHQAVAFSPDGKRLLVAGRMEGRVLGEFEPA